MMKNSEYAGIRNYRQLKEMRMRNRALQHARRDDVRKDLCALAGSLSPKAMLQELLQSISPLVELYKLFKGFR